MALVKRNSYNPKAHSPSVYIPCWLIQVSSQELSHQAKLLYGRLAQWSSAKGIVHRSVPQLSEEIGVSRSTIDRTLKELRDVGLIDTYQAEAGGVNHYQFLEHSWMSDPINKNLEYFSPVPHVTSDVTPTPDVTLPHTRCDVPKIKEIKRNKKELESAKKPAPLPLSVDNFKNEKTIELCRRKGLDIGVELNKFNNYFKGKTVFVDRFVSWLERANPVSKDSRPSPKEWKTSEKKLTRAMPPAELTGLIKSIRRKSMVQQ